MKSKAELLGVVKSELPVFLKKAKKRDYKLRIPKFKNFPQVTDITLDVHNAGIEDKFTFDVKIQEKTGAETERKYSGACFSDMENDPQCIVVNASRNMALYLKFFVEYLIYEVLSREEISLTEWNDWDKKLKGVK